MTKTNILGHKQQVPKTKKKKKKEKTANNTVLSQVLVYGSIPVGSLQEEETRNTRNTILISTWPGPGLR